MDTDKCKGVTPCCMGEGREALQLCDQSNARRAHTRTRTYHMHFVHLLSSTTESRCFDSHCSRPHIKADCDQKVCHVLVPAGAVSAQQRYSSEAREEGSRVNGAAWGHVDKGAGEGSRGGEGTQRTGAG